MQNIAQQELTLVLWEVSSKNFNMLTAANEMGVCVFANKTCRRMSSCLDWLLQTLSIASELENKRVFIWVLRLRL